MSITLWKYNPVTGFWKPERTVTDKTKDHWLEIFQKDEPKANFIVSKNKPSKKPITEDVPTVSAGGGHVAGIGKMMNIKHDGKTLKVLKVHDRYYLDSSTAKYVDDKHSTDWKGNKVSNSWKRVTDTPDEYHQKNKVNEDAPAVSAGGGHVAGIGVGAKGEPGSPPRALLKRSKFAGHEVFEVDNDVYHKARMGKAKHHRYAKYVGEDEVGTEIRQYGRDNPGKPIILKHEKTGAHQFLKYGKY